MGAFLAVQIGYQRLTEIQEEMLWICEAAHIPVIWATQVLENLVKDGIPSRGEMSNDGLDTLPHPGFTTMKMVFLLLRPVDGELLMLVILWFEHLAIRSLAVGDSDRNERSFPRQFCLF
jgi:Pyruvate kinase, barrel domain